jgi:predicted ATPase
LVRGHGSSCPFGSAVTRSFAGRLLESCPHVRVITTSRIPTQVMGEQLYPVKPLRKADAVALLV